MLLIGLKNVTTQTLDALETFNLGTVYRKYIKKDGCGIATFTNTSDAVSLNSKGIYHVSVTVTFDATDAGIATIQLIEDSIAIPGASAELTVVAGSTYSAMIDYYVIVSCAPTLNGISTAAKTISVQNTGVAIEVSSIVTNITKEV